VVVVVVVVVVEVICCEAAYPCMKKWLSLRLRRLDWLLPLYMLAE
jgi:hypothetical protein